MRTSITLQQVTVTAPFWQHYQDLIAQEVLPYQYQVLNDEVAIHIAEDPQQNGHDQRSHALANFKIAAGQMAGHHEGFVFQDSDVYKWLEAAAYVYRYQPSSSLRELI